MPPKKPTAAQKYAKYDARTTKNMAAHNAAGGSVRKPVKDVSKAGPKDMYDRAKFGSRKAQQALTLNQPLVDKKGLPTPAAMQFKRWDYPTPKNEADLRKIKAQADAAKARYAPKGKGVNRGK